MPLEEASLEPMKRVAVEAEPQAQDDEEEDDGFVVEEMRIMAILKQRTLGAG